MIPTEVLYVLLAVALFFIQNWIGSQSYGAGYIRFSLLDEKDEAHSLNFMLKVIGPTIFLILIAAASQYFSGGIDSTGLYRVVLYYVAMRISMIFVFQRALIVNWLRISAYYGSMILLAVVFQKRFISSVETLLPDFVAIKNEIWLLILIFLYQLGNSQLPTRPIGYAETETAYLPELLPRKRRYILRMHKRLIATYGDIVSTETKGNSQLGIVAYSILLFENFNRPSFVRWFERLWVRWVKSSGTTGIMQVHGETPLSDDESVRLGCQMLHSELDTLSKEDYPNRIYSRAIKLHCPDRKYIRQVLFISKAIVDHGYSKIERETTLKGLYAEISEEFGLYSAY